MKLASRFRKKLASETSKRRFMPVIKSRYDASVPSRIEFKGPGRVKPEFKDSCDINNILSKYLNTGVLRTTLKQPLYGDVSDVTSYQDAINLVMDAKDQFDSLPALVRKRFENDPARFLEFMSDPANLDEAVKLGLCTVPDGDPVVTPETKPKDLVDTE